MTEEVNFLLLFLQIIPGAFGGYSLRYKICQWVLFVQGTHQEAGSPVQTYARRLNLSNVEGEFSLRLCDIGDYSSSGALEGHLKD